MGTLQTVQDDGVCRCKNEQFESELIPRNNIGSALNEGAGFVKRISGYEVDVARISVSSNMKLHEFRSV